MVGRAASGPLPITEAGPTRDEISRRPTFPVAAASWALMLGAVPPQLPGLVIVALLLGEGMAVLTSRDVCKRFMTGLALLDTDEVASVYGPVSEGEVTSLHESLFGTTEDVSLRALSTDYHSVFGFHAQHVIRVDDGSWGVKRLDDMTAQVQVRLTSAGWQVEGFSPLTSGQ
jgi:hypothetical protein